MRCAGCGRETEEAYHAPLPEGMGMAAYCRECVVPGEVHDFPCQVCGALFPFEVNRRRRAGLFCSDRCRAIRQARQRKAQRALGKRPCEWCQQPFQPQRKDARFCGTPCRVQWHRAMKRNNCRES